MTAPVGPDINGYDFVEWLGSGGYSDVFLYMQRTTDLRVAVKVLHAGRLDSAERDQFSSEASVMAKLSGHPNIVQVFGTGETADGRPYLVMRYYPPPNLGDRVAQQPLSPAEALDIGIKIAAALETAHVAGILHRDIKPSNILLDDYNEPGLADFGIAGKTGDAEEDGDVGVSVPWAPPEVLTGKSNGSPAADVYSLAATVWQLLVGRPPFEIPGGENRNKAMLGRILTVPARGTGRLDVDERINRVLVQALAKDPEHRPASAHAFALQLQGVQQALHFGRTNIKLAATGRTVHDDARLVVTPPRPPVPESGPRPTSQRPQVPAGQSAPAGPQPTARRPQAPSTSPSPQPTSLRPAVPAVGSSPQPTSLRPQVPTRDMRQPPPIGGVPEPTSLRPRIPSAPQLASPFAPPAASAAPPAASAAPPAASAAPPAASAAPPATAGIGPSAAGAAASLSDRTSRAPAKPIESAPWQLPRKQKPNAAPANTVMAPKKAAEAAPTPEPATKRRTVATTTAVIVGAVIVITAVVVGVVLSSGGHKAPTDKPAQQPVGADQGGFDSTDVAPPVVQSAYDAGSGQVTFTWTPGPGSGKNPQYVYTVGGSAAVGPSAATQAIVKTTDPTMTCIRVATVASDGTQHFAAPVCGP